MKIIIAYVCAGTGHKKAALSLFNYFKENHPDLEINLIDALERTSPLFRKFYIDGYQFLVNRALWLWRFIFWQTSLRPLRKFNRAFSIFVYFLNISYFFRLLINENPDYFISTHFLPSEAAEYLKKTNRISSKIITVITDFGVHPFWITKETDIYAIASDYTKEQLILEGIEEKKIRVTGIPIEEKFLKTYERAIACEKLGIRKDSFTVLVITGSFGIGPLEEIIKLLYKDVQVLAVCAHNQRLYLRLIEKNYANTKVFGFVDNIQELMSASDIIITKPGGLSISEVLAMELVPVFISPIPGQETENVKILKNYGIGCIPKRLSEIKNIVLDYRDHPDKIALIREKIRLIKKPYAAKEVYDVIRQNSLRPAG